MRLHRQYQKAKPLLTHGSEQTSIRGRMSFLRSALLASLLPIANSLAAGKTGVEIYQELCVNCHGARGEGVAEKYDEPLYGEKSLKSLARYIDRSMPKDEPEKCNAEDAEKVAEYIYNAFYSPQARARLSPPKIDFARMTVRQYQNAVADLLGSFSEAGTLNDEHGLRASYYNSRNSRGD